MNFGQVLNAPVITAACITGIVAFLAAIIQFTIFFIKYSYDKKANFEQVLKDKLEKIYSPLTLNLNKSFSEEQYINIEAIELLQKYGHLLSKELIKDIFDIIKIEQEGINALTSQDNDKADEYKNLRKNILEQINKEFEELHEKYNKNFFEYKMNSLLPWYSKLKTIIKTTCIIVTSVFYIMVGLAFLILKVTPNPPIFDNLFLNSFLPIWLLIVFVTTIVSLGYGSQVIFLLFTPKQHYMDFRKVPHTGIYMCLICKKNRVKFIKGDKFQPCNQHNFFEKVKSIFRLYSWRTDVETEPSTEEIITPTEHTSGML